jgi:hypothetical protein
VREVDVRTAIVAALLLSASPSGALLVVAEDLSSVRADTCVIGSESGPPTFEDPIELLPPNPGTGWLTSGIYCGAGYAVQYAIDSEAGSVTAYVQATTPYRLTYTDLTSTIDLLLFADADGWIDAWGSSTYRLNGQTRSGGTTLDVVSGVPFHIELSVRALDPLDGKLAEFQFHASVPEPGTAFLLALGLAITARSRRPRQERRDVCPDPATGCRRGS